VGPDGESVEGPVLSDTDRFGDGTARRMATTYLCRDCDSLRKVDGAGGAISVGGRAAQIMHNGVLVEWGGYYGEWMAELIRVLRGHHEPQEELIFDAIVNRVASDGPAGHMIEFGSYWAYYGIWFLKSLPEGRLVAVEPDLPYLKVGLRNAELNNVLERCRFIHAAIGADPGVPLAFQSQSDGQLHHVDQHDLASIMNEAGIPSVDVVLCDAQGAELVLLERSVPLLREGKVRFLVVSTHHHSISGDPLTHQKCLSLLQDAGAQIIAEHSVSESFSGDGLIAASFHPQDQDLEVSISYARAKDSLFGEAEHDLARACAYADELEEALASSQARVVELEDALSNTVVVREGLRSEIDAMKASKTWRWSRPPANLYRQLRGPFRNS
jgi:FkbM family methyltransferase